MKDNNKLHKFLFGVVPFICLCCTGCIKDKMNKSDYVLTEIFDGYKWIKEGNSYTKTIISNDKYIYYFDKNDYTKNYFSIKNDNGEAKYYYVIDLLHNDNCDVALNDLLEKNNCNDDDITVYNRLIFSFNVMNEDMKLQKQDLFIVESDLKNKIIHIDVN